jgi:hypothetical protein
MEADSRYVHILWIIAKPDGPWTTRQIQNLLMVLGDRAEEFRLLICDRVGQFAASFDAVLDGAGIEAVKIRPQKSSRTPMPKGRNHRPARGHRPDTCTLMTLPTVATQEWRMLDGHCLLR